MMKVRRRKTSVAPADTNATALENRGPMWVQEMHAHYREHGFYRPEDLTRVLGDPTKSVGGHTSPEFVATYSPIKRDHH
jgi:hypothetical protein